MLDSFAYQNDEQGKLILYFWELCFFSPQNVRLRVTRHVCIHTYRDGGSSGNIIVAYCIAQPF